MAGNLVPLSAVAPDQPLRIAVDFGSDDYQAWWLYRVENGRIVVVDAGHGVPPRPVKDISAIATVTRR